jgi:Tfp pilus assembly protein PilF
MARRAEGETPLGQPAGCRRYGHGMRRRLIQPRASAELNLRSKANYVSWILLCEALVYAFLAGFHTLQDFDLGWQIASGRWVVQHHQIFSTDVFSYTAHGAPWIYPVLSGILFYLLYVAGGYALLSWLGAAVCAGILALLLRRDNILSIALAIIAVPLIANRTQPRAEMFTTFLFAAFLSLLWRHYCGEPQSTRRSPLWLLPILMVAWVNLHPGFIAGMALCAAYAGLEVLELPFPEYRAAALARLKGAWPWLLLTGVATLINPWGVRIYSAVIEQARAQELHRSWIVEWGNVRPSWSSLQQALDWRDPQSSFWWLLLIAVVCAAVAVWRRRWGAFVWLAGSAYLTIQHVRLQALFACVAVVVCGSILREAWSFRPLDVSKRLVPKPGHTEWTRPGLVVLTVVLVVLAAVRCFDLIGNGYYLRSAQLSEFGSGLSWWFPERAADFMQREKLPTNIFNGYTLGGYLTWRLSPGYPDYIDGRALPFGPQLFFRAYELSVEPPSSLAWQQAADAWGINTIVVSLARYEGITLFPQLPAFCHSQSWRPVYMDEVSAVFVRRTPQTNSLIDRLQIDCDKVSFAPLTYLGPYASIRDRAEQFNSWANAAGILYSLGRYSEAIAYLDHAQTIFADNANLHLTRALVLERTGRAAEAEAEFRTSLHLEPSDEAWLDFGLFYMTQKRYAEAVDVFRRSAESSARPHDMWMLLGQAELQMNQPQPALEAFDKAEASRPFRNEGESLGASFSSMVATGRAKAWYQLGDVTKAVSFQEEAVKLAPNDSQLWLGLADLYDAQGRTTKAAEARGHAVSR